MVLVCLSHVRTHFEEAAPALFYFATWLSRTATPTFLLLSGFIAAYVLRSDSTRRTRVTLVDRGLFLLLAAHLLLGLVELPGTPLFEWLFVRTMITDAIGVALCLAVLLRNLSAATLLAVGLIASILSWPIGATLTVESDWARRLAVVLFSLRSEPNQLVDVALVPYLGLFVIGMGLSTAWRNALTARDHRALARRFLITGGCAVGAALGAIAAWSIAHNVMLAGIEPHVVDILRQTVNPGTKWPPSPGYLLFYGGAGLLMAGLFFHGRPRPLVQSIVARAAMLGRASLMCFVVQDWLLFVTPRVFGFAEAPSPTFWVLYFCATVLALYVLASAWSRAHGNRFLTIGLKRLLLKREEEQRRAVATHAATRG